MEYIQSIVDFVINLVMTLPIHSIITFIIVRIAMRFFGWTLKKSIQLIIIYLLLVVVGQMYGFRVPTIEELFKMIETQIKMYGQLF